MKNDIGVCDCPKSLIENSSGDMRIIVIPHEDDVDITVIVSLSGVTSYFLARKPTPQVVETYERLESDIVLIN